MSALGQKWTFGEAESMSALGQKLTFGEAETMSALPPKADVTKRRRHVRFVPKAAVSRCSKWGRIQSPSSAIERTLGGKVMPLAALTSMV
jgi:hypothetical protein